MVLSWDKGDRCARVTADRKSALLANIIIYITMIYNRFCPHVAYIYIYTVYVGVFTV